MLFEGLILLQEQRITLADGPMVVKVIVETLSVVRGIDIQILDDSATIVESLTFWMTARALNTDFRLRMVVVSGERTNPAAFGTGTAVQ